MRSRFPICTCHEPTCQKQSHKSRQCETAGVATEGEPQEFRVWRKFCGGNPQQESPYSQLVVLSKYDLAEILRRKSTARISACLNALGSAKLSLILLIIRWFEKAPQAGGRGGGYLLGILAGMEASQVAEDTGCYTSSISAKATLSAKLSQREKMVRSQESWRLKMSTPITKYGDDHSPLKKNATYSSSILFDSFLEDPNHKICPRFLKKNNFKHCQPSSAKAKQMHCEIQINTQYSALATNMLWSCQNHRRAMTG